MMNRIFALASVSALGGLVTAAAGAGCSTTEEKAAAPADAGVDVRRVKEAGPPTPEDAGEEEEPTSCMTTNAIDATQFPYAKPVNTPGACTNDELKAISAFFKTKTSADEEVLVSEWSKEVSAKCAKCTFGPSDAAQWAPILVKDDRLDNVNRGGCIELVSDKEGCGRTYQQATECRLNACLQECKTQDEFSACLQDTNAIFTGPCKGAFDALSKECGNNLGAYEKACQGTAWTFEGPIKAQCIGTGAKPDGGD